MSAAEFRLIDRHLTGLGASRRDVTLGVGDDAALLAAPAGAELRIACAGAAPTGATGDSAPTDVGRDAAPTGASGEPGALARDCVHRAVTELASCGAEPAWAVLALSLDGPDEAWVAAFAAGLHAALAEAGVCLVGGDTTAGPTAATLFLTGPARR